MAKGTLAMRKTFSLLAFFLTLLSTNAFADDLNARIVHVGQLTMDSCEKRAIQSFREAGLTKGIGHGDGRHWGWDESKTIHAVIFCTDHGIANLVVSSSDRDRAKAVADAIENTLRDASIEAPPPSLDKGNNFAPELKSVKRLDCSEQIEGWLCVRRLFSASQMR